MGSIRLIRLGADLPKQSHVQKSRSIQPPPQERFIAPRSPVPIFLLTVWSRDRERRIGVPFGGMSPKSESVATVATTNSSKARAQLSTYVDFLAHLERPRKRRFVFDKSCKGATHTMAAIFDKSNAASPLAYPAPQTALLLMDFQNFIIPKCGPSGADALAKAKVMKDWATSKRIMIIHSVVDVNGRPPTICKGGERINSMLAELANDKDGGGEPPEIAFNKQDGEYVVLKHPGFVSALKSAGITELLSEHGIKSLILCGLATSGAVLRTAMPATDDGYVVSVIQDACADPRDGLHDTLIQSVLPSRAHVATAEQFMAEWAKANG